MTLARRLDRIEPLVASKTGEIKETVYGIVDRVDIVDGESGTVQMCEVFSLPKSAGSAIVQGDAVIFDVSASAFVPSSATPAEGDIVGACTAWEAAESAATSVAVKINTGVGTVTPA